MDGGDEHEREAVSEVAMQGRANTNTAFHPFHEHPFREHEERKEHDKHEEPDEPYELPLSTLHEDCGELGTNEQTACAKFRQRTSTYL